MKTLILLTLIILFGCTPTKKTSISELKHNVQKYSVQLEKGQIDCDNYKSLVLGELDLMKK